ncbi:MAG: helix-turn-helix transcriptional regulator [Gemmatimonadetes bacterium]|nr:helix-turn-helix transcriptional regulator [Gemmatimonadota bacterium]
MPNETPPLRRALVAARKARRLSQLQLALRLGVSQRHVSFVESGRAAPSRELLAGGCTSSRHHSSSETRRCCKPATPRVFLGAAARPPLARAREAP